MTHQPFLPGPLPHEGTKPKTRRVNTWTTACWTLAVLAARVPLAAQDPPADAAVTVEEDSSPLKATAVPSSPQALETKMPDIAGFWTITVPSEPLPKKAKVTPAKPGDGFDYLLSIADVPPIRLTWLPEKKVFQSGEDEVDAFREWWYVTSDVRTVYRFSTNSDKAREFLEGLFQSPENVKKDDQIKRSSNNQLRSLKDFDRIQSTKFLIVESKEGLDAYSETTGTWDRVAVEPSKDGFPRMTEMTAGQQLAIVIIDGRAIIYNSDAGKWSTFDVPADAKALITVGIEFLIARVGDQLLGFSAKANWGSLLTIPPELISQMPPPLGPNSPTVQMGDKTYALSSKTGQWTSADANEVLLFYAKWAIPCQKLLPIVRQMIGENYPIRLVDVDQERDMTKEYRITTVPTFLVFKNGEEIQRKTGVLSKSQILELFQASKPRVGKSDAAPPGEATRIDEVRPDDKPQAEQSIKIFPLANADAGELARLIKDLFPAASAVSDARTNSVIVTSDDEELARIEAVLLRLDEPRASDPAAAPIRKGRDFLTKGRIPQIPAAQRLAGEIARHEAEAARLAEQIRNQFDSFRPHRPDLWKAHRNPNPATCLVCHGEASDQAKLQPQEKLRQSLAAALELKFQLEALQIEDLRGRLSRLEQQIGQRKALREKIVDRRAEELIEGDATRWESEAEANDAAAAQAADESEEPRVSETQPSSPANSESRKPETARDAVKTEASAPGLVTALADAQSAVADAKSELDRMEKLAEQKVAPQQELDKARRRWEAAVRRQQALRDEYAALLRDLALQIEAAKKDVESATVVANSRQAELDAGVPGSNFATLEEAKQRLNQAKLSLDRLQNRYDFLKNGGEGLVDPPKSKDDARPVTYGPTG